MAILFEEKILDSPYQGKDIKEWRKITEALNERHPLRLVIVACVKNAWNAAQEHLKYNIEKFNYNFLERNQAVFADVLEKHICKQFSLVDSRFQEGLKSLDKDLVCKTDSFFDLEVKTSKKKDVWANVGHAKNTSSKKQKSGYLLGVFYEPVIGDSRFIRDIRLGWVDQSDWKIDNRKDGGTCLNKTAMQDKFMSIYRPITPYLF